MDGVYRGEWGSPPRSQAGPSERTGVWQSGGSTTRFQQRHNIRLVPPQYAGKGRKPAFSTFLDVIADDLQGYCSCDLCRSTVRTSSTGRPYRTCPSIPSVVSAVKRAFTTASSVASTVAAKSAFSRGP